MSKFNNKYRIESNRMPGWDYSRNGYYFITLVVEGRDTIFGKIKNNKTVLSDFGKIAENEWHESFKIRKELKMDEFIVMPNHLHAIVIINNKNHVDDIIGGDNCNNGRNVVETHGRASLHPNNPNCINHIIHPTQSSNQQISNPKLYRQSKSLSSFIGGYKSSVTTKIDDFIDLYDLGIQKYNRRNRLWQVNYHDHIIRNYIEYSRIKE